MLVSPTAILYPAVAMFFLTLGCLLTLGLSRYRAIRAGEVKISYYRTYDEGVQPKRLHLLARHIQNHFEVPPLFYIGVILTYVTDSVGVVAVVCAWSFVAARVLHTYIHLGSNNVSHRFFAFGMSLTFLAALWALLLFGLLAAR